MFDFLGYLRVRPQIYLLSPWCRNGDLERYAAAHPDLPLSEKLRFVSSVTMVHKCARF